VDQTDQSRNHNIGEIPVKTLSFDLETLESDLAGGSQAVAQLFEGVDQFECRSVVGDSIDQALKFLLEGSGILLPLLVLREEGLSVIEQLAGFAVGPVGNDITRLVQGSVDEFVQFIEVG